MSLLASKSRLQAIVRELSAQWEDTKETWQDEKAREFEKEFLEELFASVDGAARVLDDLEKVSSKLKSDCE